MFQGTTGLTVYSNHVTSPAIGGMPFSSFDLRSACLPKTFIHPVLLGIQLGLCHSQYEALSGSSQLYGSRLAIVARFTLIPAKHTTPNSVILPPASLSMMLHRAAPRTILPENSPKGCVCMQLASRVTIYPGASLAIYADVR